MFVQETECQSIGRCVVRGLREYELCFIASEESLEALRLSGIGTEEAMIPE